MKCGFGYPIQQHQSIMISPSRLILLKWIIRIELGCANWLGCISLLFDSFWLREQGLRRNMVTQRRFSRKLFVINYFSFLFFPSLGVGCGCWLLMHITLYYCIIFVVLKYMEELGCNFEVYRNDELTVDELKK